MSTRYSHGIHALCSRALGAVCRLTGSFANRRASAPAVEKPDKSGRVRHPGTRLHDQPQHAERIEATAHQHPRVSIQRVARPPARNLPDRYD
jgi:hypothetical protein